ncbi:MAG TPA: LemA family protein [Candidatus Saccharimonadales bacterium]|nr:LemA family protein [Candidatus Saccharimonadales bacterium]
MTLTWILIIVAVILVIVVIAIYNGLVKLKIRTEEAWSDITVQLKRRMDLIPNLVNAVKGYAKHEKEVFENVTKARADVLGANGVKETAKAENQFEQTLKSLFAVAENYPQLRATENFQKLQDELTDTEDKIMASRRFYNGAVRELNTKTDTFPSNMIANAFGFKKRDFFEVENMADVEKPVEVKL